MGFTAVLLRGIGATHTLGVCLPLSVAVAVASTIVALVDVVVGGVVGGRGGVVDVAVAVVPATP